MLTILKKTLHLAMGKKVTHTKTLGITKRKKIMAVTQYIIVGLGNPGGEYQGSRHNAGRSVVELFCKAHSFPAFAFDKKINALIATSRANTQQVMMVLPETSMNTSGEAVKKLVSSQKRARENLIVIHDDLDLPLGRIKIVKNRGSGGHKGVESVMRALKTENFTRIRIGIAKPASIQKSQKKQEVLQAVIGKFTPKEKLVFNKVARRIQEAIETIITEGTEKAMNRFNV